MSNSTVSKPTDANLRHVSFEPYIPWFIAGIGLLTMYVPTFRDLARTLWAGDQQGHGPIVFAISLWLLWQGRHALLTSQPQPAPIGGYTVLVSGLMLYMVGRSQSILLLEVGSFIVLLCAVGLLLSGPHSVRQVWFALFFMLFMIPLPGVLVDALTQPMKIAVSYIVEMVLYHLDYPISRTGVVLQIGQYQLLVADACAGLNTLFTLEALGLLYLNLVKHQSAARNVSLALCIVPISFMANVIRVTVLTLITYHFGDDAGQGFLHKFSGMVLFMAALLLTIACDGLLRTLIADKPKKMAAA